MDKVKFNDKQMFTLDDIREVSTLTEEYVRRVVQDMLYNKSQLVKIFGSGKVEPTVPAGDSVTVPEFVASHEGRLIHTIERDINVAGTAASDIILIPAGPGTPPLSGYRRDTIVVRHSTLEADPADVWYIDPTQNPPVKRIVHENSRIRDSYEFGILRGLDNNGTPRPFAEGDWIQVCTVDVRAGMVPAIVADDINTNVPITQIDVLMDPLTGHRHFGRVPGDAPRLDHDLSLDPATVKPNQHHNQLHDINDPLHHTGTLGGGFHGYVSGAGSYHDMVGIQGSISVNQHGSLTASVTPGGLPCHGPATLSEAGFMTPAQVLMLQAAAASNLKIISGITYHGRTVRFDLGTYSGGGVAPGGFGDIAAPSEVFYGTPLVFATPPIVICSLYIMPFIGNGASLTTGHNHGFAVGVKPGSILVSQCEFVCQEQHMEWGPATGWIQWIAIGVAS